MLHASTHLLGLDHRHLDRRDRLTDAPDVGLEGDTEMLLLAPATAMAELRHVQLNVLGMD